jgi:hypothetical protein
MALGPTGRMDAFFCLSFPKGICFSCIQPRSLARNGSPQRSNADPSTEQSLSIWFFVGVLMLACGLLILGQGICEFFHPGTTVLANLHPAFWWGMVMTLFGGFYTLRFGPGKA